MIPSTYWYDEQWGRATHAEAHCRRASCNAVNDLVLQDDGTFLCSKDAAIDRARATAKQFGPTDDFDQFFAQLEVTPCP